MVFTTAQFQCCFEVRPGFIVLVDIHISLAASIVSLLVILVFLNDLRGILDGVVILFDFVIAEGQVEADGDLDLLDVSNGCLVVWDNVVFVLKKHLHSEESLIVVHDSVFEVFAVSIDVTILLFDIGDLQLVLY